MNYLSYLDDLIPYRKNETLVDLLVFNKDVGLQQKIVSSNFDEKK